MIAEQSCVLYELLGGGCEEGKGEERRTVR